MTKKTKKKKDVEPKTLNIFQKEIAYLFDGKTEYLEELASCPYITPKRLFEMFLKDVDICHFLNSKYNNIEMGYSSSGTKHFLEFCRDIIQKKGLKRQDCFFSFIKKQDEIIKKILSENPDSKEDEAKLLVDRIMRTEDSNKIEELELVYGDKIFDTKRKVSGGGNVMSKKPGLFSELESRIAKDNTCKNCPLYDRPQVFLDGNVVKNPDVLFLLQAPGRQEAELGCPAVGPAGKRFREELDNLLRVHPKLKYVIANTALCYPEKDVLPKDAISFCSDRLKRIINYVDPKIIYTLGAVPTNAVGLYGNIAELVGSVHILDRRPVFANYHPSFVMRNKGLQVDIDFGAYFNMFSDYLSEFDHKDFISALDRAASGGEYIDSDEGIITVPEKYYGDEYYLLDVQKISYYKMLYIFKNKKTNKKEFFVYKCSDSNPIFFYYSKADPAGLYSPVVDTSECIVRKMKSFSDYNVVKEGARRNKTYGLGVSPQCLHVYEYNKRKKFEVFDGTINKLFFDIEVYAYRKGFGSDFVKDAAYPVVCISVFDSNGKFHKVMFYDPLGRKDDNIGNSVCLDRYNTEEELIVAFGNILRSKEYDVVTAWNASFDFSYLFNRCEVIGLDPKKIFTNYGYKRYSEWDNIWYLDSILAVDMLKLYKSTIPQVRESYSLDYISEFELGEKKVSYAGSLDSMFENDLEKYLRYSFRDSELLYKLDKKLEHIDMRITFKDTCCSDWETCLYSGGLVSTMLYKTLRNEGRVSRSAQMNEAVDGKIRGAFVLKTRGEYGIFENVCDFDFRSHYPNAINTFNIGPNTYFAKVGEKFAFRYLFFKGKVKEKKVSIVYDPSTTKQPDVISIEDFDELAKKYILTVNGCLFKRHEEEKSIYYNILQYLLTTRKVEKKTEYELYTAGDEKWKIHHRIQNVLKILANSFYGCLAFKKFDFFDRDLAEAVTRSCRALTCLSASICEEVLPFVRDGRSVEPGDVRDSIFNRFSLLYDGSDSGLKYILYGDTDSLFAHIDEFVSKENVLTSDYVENKVSELQKRINEFSREYCKVHNIGDEEYYVFLKNELIMRRYLQTVAKKKYAAHIVKKEGIVVDEIYIRGIETRRSDYSRMTREKLLYVIETVLYGKKTIPEMALEIKRIDEEFVIACETGSVDIAKPVHWNKEYYETNVQHFRGVKLYNFLYKDKMTVGDRGYLFFIRGINYDAFSNECISGMSEIGTDVIVVPQTADRLPKEFAIDVEKTLDYAWRNRIEKVFGNTFNINSRKKDVLHFF